MTHAEIKLRILCALLQQTDIRKYTELKGDPIRKKLFADLLETAEFMANQFEQKGDTEHEFPKMQTAGYIKM